MYGMPLLDQMMRDAGYEMYFVPSYSANGKQIGGEWKWRMKQGDVGYDLGQVQSDYAQARDKMEPEMLRQIAAAEGELGQRGMSRSSLMPGAQGGMRGEFVTNLMKKRLELVQSARKERWQKLITTAGMADEMTRSLAAGRTPTYIGPPQQDTSTTDWGGILSGLSWFL